MISIPWLKFLFLIISLIKKFHYPYNVFWGFRFFIMTLQFLNIFFLLVYVFFALLLFPFPPFSLFLFFFFLSFFLISPFFSYFPLFSFFLFASFPQFGLPFPKSAAPVLPHFLLPWVTQWSPICDRRSRRDSWFENRLVKIDSHKDIIKEITPYCNVVVVSFFKCSCWWNMLMEYTCMANMYYTFIYCNDQYVVHSKLLRFKNKS